MAVDYYHTAVIFFLHIVTFCTIKGSLHISSFHCEALAHSFLFRSKETFKLAEIQNLEASLQIPREELFHDETQFILRYNCTRLLVDRATGSSLFRLDLQCKGAKDETFTTINSVDGPDVPRFMFSKTATGLIESQILSLSSIRRCDWIGQVVVEARNPPQLIRKLQRHEESSRFSSDGIGIGEWTLDYAKMVGANASKTTYTMKSLLCAVAHDMPTRPSLYPDLADKRFLVLDTSSRTPTNATEDTESSFYLIRHIDKRSVTDDKSSHQIKWATRPFQYSSAINFELADIVIEILVTLCKSRNHSKDQKMVLHDPTCGSGTFLALAISKGLYVEGCDSNPSAVDGTRRNLEYLYSKKKVEICAQVEIHDSCAPWKDNESLSNATISCVVANLPWGKNSVLYIDENERILCSVRSQIQVGTPCAFVTRSSNADDNKSPTHLFETNGFHILGQSFVPQRDFLLPSGGKRKRKKDQIGKSKKEGYLITSHSQNQCVITIAMAA